MKGAGVGGAIAKSSEGFFFIWTLLALGVTALLLCRPLCVRTVEAIVIVGGNAAKTRCPRMKRRLRREWRR